MLAPCPTYGPDASANDSSLVLRISYGARSVLLVGDAEHEEERARSLGGRAGGSLRADLLKVGHHGSRTSSGPAFLAAVRPGLAAISAGVRNRFGHPHPVIALAAPRRAGDRPLRTDGPRGRDHLGNGRGQAVRVRRP